MRISMGPRVVRVVWCCLNGTDAIYYGAGDDAPLGPGACLSPLPAEIRDVVWTRWDPAGDRPAKDSGRYDWADWNTLHHPEIMM
jgi:hypothetical protein